MRDVWLWIGIAFLGFVFLALIIHGPSEVATNRLAENSVTPGYTPVTVPSTIWDQLPPGEKAAFGVTDSTGRIRLAIIAHRDTKGWFAQYVDRDPHTVITNIMKNPTEAGRLARQDMLSTLPEGSGKVTLEVLHIIVVNVGRQAFPYNPMNFYFRQNRKVIPITTIDLIKEGVFKSGGLLQVNESIDGFILIPSNVDTQQPYELWYGHNYGLLKNR